MVVGCDIFEAFFSSVMLDSSMTTRRHAKQPAVLILTSVVDIGTLVDNLCQTAPFLRRSTLEHLWTIYVKQRFFTTFDIGTLVDVLRETTHFLRRLEWNHLSPQG